MEENLVNILGAAVLPAVLVSAGAVMLQGVLGEHRALADRVRALSHELRVEATTERRRRSLLAQVALFRPRVRAAMWAAITAYGSIAAYLADVFMIAVRGIREGSDVVRVLFVLGSALLIVAVTLVVLELRLANRTLDLEIEDHMSELDARWRPPRGLARRVEPRAE